MSRNPTLSYVLCSVLPLLNCNTKESMWDLLMKYLCPRDFRRGEMEEKMKKIKKIAMVFLLCVMMMPSVLVKANESTDIPPVLMLEKNLYQLKKI